MQRAGEARHAGKRGLYFRRGIFGSGVEAFPRCGAQRHMQRSAAFRGIHRVTGKKPGAKAFNIARPRQI